MLRNNAVVIIRDADVENNTEQHTEIEQREIQTIFSVPCKNLNCPVNTQNIERLYQQIENKQKNKIAEKSLLHVTECKILIPISDFRLQITDWKMEPQIHRFFLFMFL